MSPGNEAFRTLRTSVSTLGREPERRSFLVTSALPSEGKSFTALNLAAAFAQQGLRTLLIDADLRRPTIQETLGGGNREHPGVTDCLVDGRLLEALVQEVPSLPKLSWLPAGKSAPNPAELLAQGPIGGLIDQALAQYDRVVLDSPPVHAVSDALLLGKLVQTTLLVVHGSKTPRGVVLRAIKLLGKAGASTSGVVLNLLPSRRGRGYYYSYDNYYHYGHDDGDGHKRRKKRVSRTKAEESPLASQESS